MSRLKQDLLKQLEAVRFRLANVYKSIEMGIEPDDLFRENRRMRIRMFAGVEAGGEKPLATRLAHSRCEATGVVACVQPLAVFSILSLSST